MVDLVWRDITCMCFVGIIGVVALYLGLNDVVLASIGIMGGVMGVRV